MDHHSQKVSFLGKHFLGNWQSQNKYADIFFGSKMDWNVFILFGLPGTHTGWVAWNNLYVKSEVAEM